MTAHRHQAWSPRAILLREPDELEKTDQNELSRLSCVAGGIFELEDLAGAQKSSLIPLALPFDYGFEGLMSLTRSVRRLLGINEAVIFDYLELLENAGMRITFLPMPEGIQSLSCFDEINSNVLCSFTAR